MILVLRSSWHRGRQLKKLSVERVSNYWVLCDPILQDDERPPDRKLHKLRPKQWLRTRWDGIQMGSEGEGEWCIWGTQKDIPCGWSIGLERWKKKSWSTRQRPDKKGPVNHFKEFRLKPEGKQEWPKERFLMGSALIRFVLYQPSNVETGLERKEIERISWEASHSYEAVVLNQSKTGEKCMVWDIQEVGMAWCERQGRYLEHLFLVWTLCSVSTCPSESSKQFGKDPFSAGTTRHSRPLCTSLRAPQKLQ